MSDIPDHLTAALAYAERGWRIFPLPPRCKKPILKDWPNKATADLDRVRRHWTANPTDNIALVTGDIVALDVDPGHDGGKTLAVLEMARGALPRTIAAMTGSGGVHFYLKTPPGLPGGIRNSAGAIGPGLDVRGTGGFIVVPPSVHPNGHRYVFFEGRAPGEAEIELPPMWLLHAMTSAAPAGEATGGTRITPQRWRALFCGTLESGARNDALARLTGHLIGKKLDAVMVLEILRLWNTKHCSPPMDDAEVVATVASICRKDGRIGR